MCALEQSLKLKEVYWKVGFTIERAQGLEIVTKALIALLKEFAEKPEGGVIVIEPGVKELSRRTLGWLFRELRLHTPIPAETAKHLRAGLNARNSLIHGFFTKHITGFHTKVGLSAALEDLDSIFARINKAISEVNTAFRFLAESHTDVDFEDLEEGIRRQLEEERDIDD